MEKEAREKELELQEEWYEDLMDITRIEWFGMYMNAYCETFDPHTNYLAPQQNENFELSMTGQFEGIGAQLKQEGDYIGIERIIAGLLMLYKLYILTLLYMLLYSSIYKRVNRFVRGNNAI